jgi:hypothetical protein
MNGAEGAQAARVRECASRWAAELGLTVVFVDERLTSVEASRSVRAAGVDTKRQRGRLDMVAAALILQAYLDLLQSTRHGEHQFHVKSNTHSTAWRTLVPRQAEHRFQAKPNIFGPSSWNRDRPARAA